jgi:REP element-mobilizing transposase RayT
MIHSFVRNYLHITWSTKERVRVFNEHSKIHLKNFMFEKAKEIEALVSER